jgi:hypothetical protein
LRGGGRSLHEVASVDGFLEFLFGDVGDADGGHLLAL